jgi:hypothetical protein
MAIISKTGQSASTYLFVFLRPLDHSYTNRELFISQRNFTCFKMMSTVAFHVQIVHLNQLYTVRQSRKVSFKTNCTTTSSITSHNLAYLQAGTKKSSPTRTFVRCPPHSWSQCYNHGNSLGKRFGVELDFFQSPFL